MLKKTVNFGCTKMRQTGIVVFDKQQFCCLINITHPIINQQFLIRKQCINKTQTNRQTDGHTKVRTVSRLSQCSAMYVWLFGIATPLQTHSTFSRSKKR